MGKASSAKKVARAARAGGSRRAGQRRQLGFPAAVAVVLVLGLLLVFVARDRRNADAFPRANQDHVHASIDIYTCVTLEESTGASSTTTTSTTTTVPPSTSSGETTTTTTPATSTTQLNSTDVHGEYQPAPTDATQDALGIHTHGDGLIHIHPFKDSVAGRNATLGVFLDQVGISMTNTTLSLPTGKSFTEGTTKCEGGKDGVVQVAVWDHADEAARGNKPNQIFTSGFDKIRLRADASFVIAFMPDGSTIKAKPDVQDRISKVTDVPTTTSSNASGAPASGAPSSGAPASGAPASGAPASGAPASSTTATTATTTPASTSSSSP